tara:strand:+ start:129 stop:569 length:441 start_codon:yes stop_codon:yes gene_type:complete
MFIYKIICNNEFYIGSTGSIKHRYRQHKYCCNKEGNDKYNLPVYKYIRDNGGWDNIIYEIVGEYDIKDLIKQKQKEQEYIEKYKPTLNKGNAHSGYDTKKDYDKVYNTKRKKYLCPCCNKYNTKQGFALHKTTKKYKNYQFSLLLQ